MKASFIFGYKYTSAEIDQLKQTVYPEDGLKHDQFFADYLVGPTQTWGEWFIGITLAETTSSKSIDAEELKLQPNQLRELKYIMMNIHVTEPPKFYIICTEEIN